MIQEKKKKICLLAHEDGRDTHCLGLDLERACNEELALTLSKIRDY